MLANRSVPPNQVLPHVVYRDVSEASAWLSKTLGFVEYYRYGEPASGGVMMHFGPVWIMLTSSRDDRSTPAELGAFTQMLTLFVEDVDSHYARVKASGAELFEDIHETMYGERQFGVEDLAGHRWLFSAHARDLSPDEWGARLAKP